MAHSSGNLALSLVEAVEVKRRDDENRNSRGNEMPGLHNSLSAIHLRAPLPRSPRKTAKLLVDASIGVRGGAPAESFPARRRPGSESRARK